MKFSAFSIGLLACALVVAPTAHAGNIATGLYGGGGLVGTFWDPGEGDAFGADTGFYNVNLDDEEDIGWSVFAGYRVFDYFAIEGGWLDLGGFEGTALSGGFGARGSSLNEVKSSTDVDGWNIRALGILPVLCGDLLSIHASTGAYFYDTQFNSTDSNSQRFKDGDSGVAWTVGAGLESHPIPEVGLRLAYEHYFDIENGVGEFDADAVMLSVIFGPIWGLY
jgi:opacity protein-like surface antigen